MEMNDPHEILSSRMLTTWESKVSKMVPHAKLRWYKRAHGSLETALGWCMSAAATHHSLSFSLGRNHPRKIQHLYWCSLNYHVRDAASVYRQLENKLFNISSHSVIKCPYEFHDCWELMRLQKWYIMASLICNLPFLLSQDAHHFLQQMHRVWFSPQH
jgi:hypothetical protein